MINLALFLGFGALMLAVLLGLVRLARGPTVLDRILAFDLIATSAVGMVVLLSVKWQTAIYLELILIFSLLGFVGTVAFVFHLHQTLEDRPPQASADAPTGRSSTSTSSSPP
jgi:multisubunit Na+/H+ antiporter MnhF subunit